MRNKLTIEISGEDISDLKFALNEVQRLVSQGYLSGFDSNDTGEYRFEIKEDWDEENDQSKASTDNVK